MSIKLKKLNFIVSLTLFLLFLLFIIFYENNNNNNNNKSLKNISKIASDYIWNFDKKGLKNYLKVIVNSKNYLSIIVYNENDEIFFKLIDKKKINWINILDKISLYFKHKCREPINYNHEKIGSIEILHFSKTLYTYLYLFIILILIKIISIFYIKQLKSNEILEQQISIRTKELKKSKEEYKQIFNATDDAIFVHDANTGDIIDVNDGMLKMFGYTDKREIIKNPNYFNDRQSPFIKKPYTTKEALEYLKKAKKEGTQVFEWLSLKKDHSTFWTEISLKYNKSVDNNKELITAVVRNIEERKKQEIIIQKMNKLESLGILAGGIAHDFNNILTAILGNINLASMLNKDNEISEILEDAEKASIRAKDLTGQLLIFSKGGEPIKKEISIKKLIKESASFNLRGTSIKSYLNFEKDLWNINADPGQINQVIQNLLINAIQTMSSGGEIKIDAYNYINQNNKISYLKEDKYIKISISDTGRGIPKDIMNKIFDPYFTTKKQGNGLGLSIINSIILKHDGHIDVKSTVNKGTTFTIFLPAIENVQEQEKNIKKEKIENKLKYKILIMDDEEIIRKVAKKILNLKGHEVVLSETGEEAIKKYTEEYNKSSAFDFVIMDLTIQGGMGGKEASEKLLKFDKNAKILVSSGYSNDPIMANFKDYGFVGRIIKPFTVNNFMKEFERLTK